MIYIEAILETKTPKHMPKLFLAGGITNCPNWQVEAIKFFKDDEVVIYNPRRKYFPIHDPKATYEQISWERDNLTKSDIILFWFCKETIQPIVLFEYGKYGFLKNKKIFVGIEEGYSRKTDVIIQTQLEFPKRKIYFSLKEMCLDIKRLL